MADYLTTEATAGPSWLPSLRFYPRMAAVVWRSRCEARRGEYDDERWRVSSVDMRTALERVGVRVTVEGLEAVRRLQGPCVYVGNHMSTLETFLLPAFLVPLRRVTFVVKEGLVRMPVFRHVMRSRDPIVVGRKNPREDLEAVLRGGAERLQQGISIIIFPQTTRTLRFDPAEFNSIGVKLARKAGVPVVPLAVRSDAWRSDGWPVKDFGRVDPRCPVHLRFGEPLAIRGNGKEENQAVIRFILASLAEWGMPGVAPEGKAGEAGAASAE